MESERLLCLACAKRLQAHSWPEVPELVEGHCPQCGGHESLPAVAEIVEHPKQRRVA